MLERLDARERAAARAKWRARHTLAIDMMKSYAAPVLVVGYVNPLVSATSPAVRLGIPNHVLLILGLAMIIGALTFVPAKE